VEDIFGHPLKGTRQLAFKPICLERNMDTHQFGVAQQNCPKPLFSWRFGDILLTFNILFWFVAKRNTGEAMKHLYVFIVALALAMFGIGEIQENGSAENP
jgi:hypothetical protein